MRDSPGRTLNPKWEQWAGKLAHCEKMIDRVKSSPASHDPKWVLKTCMYWKAQIEHLKDSEPPKWLEDVETGKAKLKEIRGTLSKPGKRDK